MSFGCNFLLVSLVISGNFLLYTLFIQALFAAFKKNVSNLENSWTYSFACMVNNFTSKSNYSDDYFPLIQMKRKYQNCYQAFFINEIDFFILAVIYLLIEYDQRHL